MTVTVASPPDIGRRRLAGWPLAAVVLAGQAMASLDTAIVNVGGPRIQRDLHLSSAGLQLTVYVYVLVYAAGLITGARLGHRYGFGRVFTWGIAVFTAASLACGLALTPAMLVTARTMQGLGAALLVPQVLSLLQTAFADERRQRALSLYGLVLAVGVAAGQVLGGILISADLFGTEWRPIFLVNVPIGTVVLALAADRLPAGIRRAAGGQDLVGAALLAAAVAGLLVPVTFGGDAGWPSWCWPVLAAGAAVLVGFGIHLRRLARNGGHPLIDPALLTRPGIGAGLAGVFVLMGCYGGLLFTIALYLQDTLHDSPLRSGLTFAAYAAGFATSSLIWTRLPAAWRDRFPACGFAAVAAGTGLLALATGHTGWPPAATLLLVVAGAGHGSGFGALVQRTAAIVPSAHAAAFSGVLSTANQLAIAVGIAATATLYQAAHLSWLPAISLTLLTLATIQAITGAAVTFALKPGRRLSHAAMAADPPSEAMGAFAREQAGLAASRPAGIAPVGTVVVAKQP
jgi:MFS family permease